VRETIENLRRVNDAIARRRYLMIGDRVRHRELGYLGTVVGVCVVGSRGWPLAARVAWDLSTTPRLTRAAYVTREDDQDEVPL
jgi:heat shock protein HspQ